jgi:hypothetical protein
MSHRYRVPSIAGVAVDLTVLAIVVIFFMLSACLIALLSRL